MINKIVFILLCAVGTLAAQAHAQLFLEDGKKTIAVSGGDHLNGSLLIHNTSSDPGNIKVYWEDFQYKAPYDGAKNFLAAGTSPTSASQWVTFSPQAFIMPSFGQQRVDYTVTVPSVIQEGHYGVLFFERNGDSLKTQEGVTLVTRVGCLFFIEPKDKVKKGVLQDIKLTADSLTLHFVNQGNVILIPRTTYYLMDGEGLVLLRGESKKLYVPPGASAPLEIPLKKKLGQGHYTLVVNSDLDEGDVVVREIGLAVDDAGTRVIYSSG